MDFEYLAILIFLLIIFVVPGIILTIVFSIIGTHKRKRKKLESYILQCSSALKKLFAINDTYKNKLIRYESFQFDHTYDNLTYYNNVSCQDYLIYKLNDHQREFLTAKKNIEKNSHTYNLYLQEITSIDDFGKFDNLPKWIDRKQANIAERRLFTIHTIHLTTELTITIILSRSNINGRIYERKTRTFSDAEIIYLIKRINNRKGDFYNDKGIWDALCRVERAKVSNKIRFMIYERDHYRCQICGKKFPAEELEIDHIKPIAKGGKSTIDNLQSLCKRCNYEKGDKY